MATVVGGQIISDPGGGFGNLLSGAGNLFQAIQGQRKQTEDQRLLEQLSQTLAGQGGQPGLAGQPGQPGAVLSPQDKLNAILNVVPQLNRPGNQELALNLATIQQRAIPTGRTTSKFGVTMDNALRSIGVDPQGAVTRQDFQKATEFRRQGELTQAAEVEKAKVMAQSTAEAKKGLFETNTAFARTLVDAQTGGPIPTGITGEEFRKNPERFVSVTDSQRRDLAKINQAVNLTGQLAELAGRIFPEEESRAAGAVRRTIGGLAQTNPDVVEFNRLRNASAGPLARALGEVGNLAEQEQQRALSIVPKNTDSPAVARRLTALSNKLVLDMRNVILRGGDVRNAIDEAVNKGDKIRTGTPTETTTTTVPTVPGLSKEAAGFLERR